MIHSIAVASLVGINQALTPTRGPLPTATFPKYPNVNAPAAGDLDGDNVKVEYSSSGSIQLGLYRALRNDLFIFPTQNFVKAGANAADTCSIGAQTTTRTFWQTKPSQLGSYPSKITSGTDSTYANGPTWVVCKDVSDALKCNGGAGYNNAATTKSHNVKTRIVYKASATAAIQVAGDATAYYWTWNNDFLLDSLYQ